MTREPSDQRTINEVLASTLAHFMTLRGMKQPALAAKSGIGQTTISLYLNPHRRKPGAKGKEPSAKLGEIQRLADALGVEVWELLRPLTPEQREIYRSVDRLLAEALKKAKHAPSRQSEDRRDAERSIDEMDSQPSIFDPRPTWDGVERRRHQAPPPNKEGKR